MTTSSESVKCVWTQLLPLKDNQYGSPCARSSHGLSCVGPNKLFLYGGEHVARTPIEDEAGWILERHQHNWQWRKLSLQKNAAPPPRVAHAQAVVDKHVYIFGGRQGITMGESPLNDLWKLDTETEAWTKIEPSSTPPEPRSFHKMVSIDNSLYVFGGCGAGGRLADLHRFDLQENAWHDLGTSTLLRGRGGANLIPFHSNKSLGIVAGFAGEETNDGHVYDLMSKAWKETAPNTSDMRPRSVCVSGSFPTLGISVVVGGEVDPSHRGHEGAGNFENDMVVLDESNGNYLGTVASSQEWPPVRGWSDGDTHQTSLYLFGGLAGDDKNPERLDDLWQGDVSLS